MISLNTMKDLATTSLGRSRLILTKFSPEIFLGLGIVGIVAGTVLACKATLKVDELTKDSKKTIKRIKDTKKVVENSYSDDDYRKDLAVTYIKTAADLVKLYAPAVVVTGLSIALIVKSHNILSKRNAALVAAYKLIDTSFKKYRERVKNEFGEEVEQRLRLGDMVKEETVEGKKGKTEKVLEPNTEVKDTNDYAVWFAKNTSSQFNRNYDYNHDLLLSAQNYINERLRVRGYAFLNEIFDMLGMTQTTTGQLVGWVYGDNPRNPNNDRCIEFGLDKPINEQRHDDEKNGGQAWFLDFNVDGPIYDMI